MSFFNNIPLCTDEKEDIYIAEISTQCKVHSETGMWRKEEVKTLREEIKDFFKRSKFIHVVEDIKAKDDRFQIEQFLMRSAEKKGSLRFWDREEA